jgi:hypothetical protein
MRILRILALGVFAVVLLSILLVFDGGSSANNKSQGHRLSVPTAGAQTR